MVRETGGLRDTVLSYNESNGAGNGFTFFNYNAHDMLYTVRRAEHYYRNAKDVWNTLIRRGMTGNYSWSHSAQTYLEIYSDLTGLPPTEFKPDAEPVAPLTRARKGNSKKIRVKG